MLTYKTSYIFVGHPGDPRKDTTPSWSKDGSFLVFRQLDQKVPEFNKYDTNPSHSCTKILNKRP